MQRVVIGKMSDSVKDYALIMLVNNVEAVAVTTFTGGCRVQIFAFLRRSTNLVLEMIETDRLIVSKGSASTCDPRVQAYVFGTRMYPE